MSQQQQKQQQEDLFDGDRDTGSSARLPKVPILDYQQEVTVRARLRYLSVNLITICITILAGYIVFSVSNSLTIEVDFFTMNCDAMGVIINVAIELVKRRTRSKKTIMILDLTGAMLSLTLLLGVSVFGVVDAVIRSRQAGTTRSQEVSHQGIMVRYSAFSLILGLMSLSYFAVLKDVMLPEGGCVHDQLNIMSNLVHSLVDFVTNFAVLGTSVWLQYGVKHEWGLKLREHKAYVDVFGAFVVCACILISICFLLRDAFHALREIREMSAEDAEKGIEKVAGDFSKAAAQSDAYGATEDAAKASKQL